MRCLQKRRNCTFNQSRRKFGAPETGYNKDAKLSKKREILSQNTLGQSSWRMHARDCNEKISNWIFLPQRVTEIVYLNNQS